MGLQHAGRRPGCCSAGSQGKNGHNACLCSSVPRATKKHTCELKCLSVERKGLVALPHGQLARLQ